MGSQNARTGLSCYSAMSNPSTDKILILHNKHIKVGDLLLCVGELIFVLIVIVFLVERRKAF